MKGGMDGWMEGGKRVNRIMAFNCGVLVLCVCEFVIVNLIMIFAM